MSSPQLEEFLARLYTDTALREQFMDNPEAAASSANLSPDEVRAVCRIDRAGLQMAAASFANKRAAYQRKPQSMFGRWRERFRIKRSQPAGK